MASAAEEVLGGGGWLLHGGADSHLHVPIQKCVRAVQTDHGHVRGRVRALLIITHWINCSDSFNSLFVHNAKTADSFLVILLIMILVSLV